MAIAEVPPMLFDNRTYKSPAQVCPRTGAKQRMRDTPGRAGGRSVGNNPASVAAARLTIWNNPAGHSPKGKSTQRKPKSLGLMGGEKPNEVGGQGVDQREESVPRDLFNRC